tara:strand:+ start:161 stop:745 length:585 start_codon:yes stop_codon:yes gene_type:complete
MSEFLGQVQTWPRAMQWAFWATVITISFLIWDSTVAELGASWSAKADEIELQIKEVNTPILFTSDVKNAVAAFGKVELPRTKAEGAAAMTEAVHEILSSHQVKDDEYTRTKTNKLKSSAMRGIATSGQQLEAVIGNIRFEATQEDILKVISDLEGNPWIDTVSDIRLTKKEGRMIRVDLSVGAWVVTTSKRGRR